MFSLAFEGTVPTEMHPQATSLSSTGDHPFTRGMHVLCYRRNQIGTRQGQFAAQGLCALQLEVGRIRHVRQVGLFQTLKLDWARRGDIALLLAS